MSLLNFIIWSADPIIVKIPLPNGGEHPIVWYGLLFALGFIIGQQFVTWFFKSEGRDEKDIDQLLMYMIAGTVLGARLGHCLFYNPDFYLSNPLEILKIWEGGLASHGGVVGILTALYLYSRNKSDQSYYWVLDKIAIVVFLSGALIRFGNYMNSEIIGLPTGSDNGVVFARNVEEMFLNSKKNIASVEFEKGGDATSSQEGQVPIKIILQFEKGNDLTEQAAAAYVNFEVKPTITRYASLSEHFNMSGKENPKFNIYKSKGNQFLEIHTLGIPRHPAQLYESFYCFVLFFVFLYIWYYHRNKFNEGFIFGLWMITLWSLRFTDEFFKENQEAFEEGMALNMGQLLSIPLIIVGLYIVVSRWKKPVVLN